MERVAQWHRAYPDIGIKESPRELLDPLFNWIKAGNPVEAHYANFEESIWTHVGIPQHDFPTIETGQWRDSAAAAAALSLPRDLAGATHALGLSERKDPIGYRLIRQYSLPKRLTKAEKAIFGEDYIIFREDPEGLQLFWDYCSQDVRSERSLSNAIPPLSPTELRIWQITQDMNRRGIRIDTDLCHKALDVFTEAKRRMDAELKYLTGIGAGSQRARLSEWLEKNEGLRLPDTQAKTVEWYLHRFSGDISDRARRVLTIIREVNRTSIKKYQTMLDSVDENGIAYDLLAYCGAERTGRWAGQGIQVQNLPKGNLPKGYTMEDAVAVVKTGDLDICAMEFGDPLALVVSCLRGALIPADGRELAVADYAAIEARCVLWLAGALDALQVFRDGGDIYCDMASGIFGRVVTKQNLTQITRTGKTERDFGKVAILGLGYGMGYIKFLLTLRDYDIYLTRDEVRTMMGTARLEHFEKIVWRKLFPMPEDFAEMYLEYPDGAKRRDRKYKAAKRAANIALRRLTEGREDPFDVIHELALCLYTVGVYRDRYEEVPTMWKAQEAGAIEAIKNPGREIEVGLVTWFVEDDFLKCRLPSKRCLHYYKPEIKPTKTAWGEWKDSIRFMGRHQKTRAWTQLATYGGKLTENITQATARDIMAYAMIELDDEPNFDLLITVHDEAVAEVDKGTVTAEEYEALMVRMPPKLFDGCPIGAEAKLMGRYRK